MARMLGLLMAAVLLGGLGYAFGTGWIRVDLPKSAQGNAPPAEPKEAPNANPLVLSPLRVTPLDSQVVPAQSVMPLVALSATPAVQVAQELPSKVILESVTGTANTVIDAESRVISDGPTSDLTFSVRLNDDTVPDSNKFTVNKVTMIRLGSDTPSVTTPTLTGTGKLQFLSTLTQVGSYRIELTISLPGGSKSTELRRSFDVQARSGEPRLEVARISFGTGENLRELSAFSQVAVGKINSFTATLTSTLGARRLEVRNNQTRAVVGTAIDGSAIATKLSPLAPFPVPINVTDQPVSQGVFEFFVVDTWTGSRSNLVTVVFRAPDEQVSSDKPRGPNVIFPEFTRPRRVPDGFNSGDKVETRVSRLYFYRDARRVAQIINRNVKAYNYVNLDTRKRQADEARDQADTATDRRRRQEAKAIRTAAATRAAERELADAQSARDQVNATVAQDSQNRDLLNERKVANTNRLTILNGAANVPDSIAEQAAKVPTDPAAPNLAAEQQRLAALKATQQQLVADNTIIDNQLGELNRRLNIQQPVLTSADQAVSKARDTIQLLRTSEAGDSDTLLQNNQDEDRQRADQFRKEVAAATEDPDVFAPGDPTSDDPVAQVSVSVIGEGLIQLRGPIKGINVIRTMINQIDSPVGQVRVNVHTVQINGERGDRMETVATKIQDQIDHSRFLTAQSGQLLRNAVVRIASRRAANIVPGPAENEEQMREKYLTAFFGADFIHELETIDSEFLRSGNKLLSLHSMDTTSLASSLFLLGLADNEARSEILEEFRCMLANDLPTAEMTFLEEGGPRGKKHPHHKDKFYLLAQNARFQAIQGYFSQGVNGEVARAEVLSPIQREFIKLAQIFKSRLVTEVEYGQRVKERSLIEERFVGSYEEEIRRQAQRDEQAQTKLEDALRAREQTFEQVQSGLTRVRARVTQEGDALQSRRSALTQFAVISNAVKLVDEQTYTQMYNTLTDKRIKDGLLPPDKAKALASWKFNQYFAQIRTNDAVNTAVIKVQESLYAKTQSASQLIDAGAKTPFVFYSVDDSNRRHYVGQFEFTPDPKITGSPVLRLTPVAPTKETTELLQAIRVAISEARKAKTTLDKFMFYDKIANQLLEAVEGDLTTLVRVSQSGDSDRTLLELSTIRLLATVLDRLVMLVDFSSRFQVKADQLSERLIQLLGNPDRPIEDSLVVWNEFEALVRSVYKDTVGAGDGHDARLILAEVKGSFDALTTAENSRRQAAQLAQLSRRPLDQKKMLDLLIDEVEDKLIELLEGSRAHISNIDSYIRALATALEDDFNTQFYFPAFREIRKASRYWDVTLAQIETTTVLTNNRGFGKVDPQATMEFDLPKRDVLLVEAMKGSKALIDQYGALLQDPTFIGLTGMLSGQPTSAQARGFGINQGSVRNVLPGLPSMTDERLFRQAAPAARDIGAPIESLVPDPAVYKFETGTGFEIRPTFQPDGQSVTFDFNYMYTSNVREPVKADEKHLGRVKRHYINTPVQLLNYEMKEVSKFQVALKASRTSRGVPLFEDIPGLGVLFRPLPNAESSLQQNIVLAQTTIFPTLFDLMGLRWAPAVADLDPLRLRNAEFVARGRKLLVEQNVFDGASESVDTFMRVPPASRRPDLYRPQATVPARHPNGYEGPGRGRVDSNLIEGNHPLYPEQSRFAPDGSNESRLGGRPLNPAPSSDGVPLQGPAGSYIPGEIINEGEAGTGLPGSPGLPANQPLPGSSGMRTRPGSAPATSTSYRAPSATSSSPRSSQPVTPRSSTSLGARTSTPTSGSTVASQRPASTSTSRDPQVARTAATGSAKATDPASTAPKEKRGILRSLFRSEP